MRVSIGKQVIAVALIATLIGGFMAPAQQVLARSSGDPKSVAINTISAVIEGLSRLRDYLQSINASPEAVAAIGQAIESLQKALNTFKETGDVTAAQSALQSSANQSEKAAHSSGSKEDEKKHNTERLREAIKKALQRAEELTKEVQKIRDESLRKKLLTEIEKAVSLLRQAQQAVEKDDMKMATQSFTEAVKILGHVVSELNRARDKEGENQHKDQAQPIKAHIEEIKKKIAKLAEEISKSPIPQDLKKELLGMLQDAARLVHEAEEALEKGDMGTAKGNLGKALATINHVEAKFKIAMREVHTIREHVERIVEKAGEIRKRVSESNLPDDVKAKVNQLLDTALDLAKQAVAAVQRGDFGEARSLVAKAEAALKEAIRILEQQTGKHEEGKEGTRQHDIEARIDGNALKVEIENEGDTITVVGVKVFTKSGDKVQEVQVDWKQSCTGTLEKGAEVKCIGIADFQKGQTYKVVIIIQKGDKTIEIPLGVTA